MARQIPRTPAPYQPPPDATIEEIIAANQHLLAPPPAPPPAPGLFASIWNALKRSTGPEGQPIEEPQPTAIPEPLAQGAPAPPSEQPPQPPSELPAQAPGFLQPQTWWGKQYEPAMGEYLSGLAQRIAGLGKTGQEYQAAAETTPEQCAAAGFREGQFPSDPLFWALSKIPSERISAFAENVKPVGPPPTPGSKESFARSTYKAVYSLPEYIASMAALGPTMGLASHTAVSEAARGAPDVEAAKGTALSAAAGKAFELLHMIPLDKLPPALRYLVQPAGTAGIFAGQTAAGGGTAAEMTESAATGLFLSAGSVRQQRQANKVAVEQNAYRERAEQLQREDQARQDRASQMAPPPRLALPPAPEGPTGRMTAPGTAIPMEAGVLWPAEKSDFVRRLAEDGIPPEQIQARLRDRLFPETPDELSEIRKVVQQAMPPTPVPPEQAPAGAPEERFLPMRRPPEPGARIGQSALDQEARRLAISGMDGRRIMYELYQNPRLAELVDEDYRPRAQAIAQNPDLIPALPAVPEPVPEAMPRPPKVTTPAAPAKLAPPPAEPAAVTPAGATPAAPVTELPRPPAPSESAPDPRRKINAKEIKAAGKHPDFQFLVDLLTAQYAQDPKWKPKAATYAKQEAARALGDLQGADRDTLVRYAIAAPEDKPVRFRDWRNTLTQAPAPTPPAAGPPTEGAPPPPGPSPEPPTEPMARPPGAATSGGEEEYQRQARLQPVLGRAAIFERIMGRPPSDAELKIIADKTPDEAEAFAMRVQSLEKTTPPIFADAVGKSVRVFDGPDKGRQGVVTEVKPHPTRGMDIPIYTVQTPEGTVLEVPSNLTRPAPMAAPAGPPAFTSAVPAQGELAPVEGPRGAETPAYNERGQVIRGQYVLVDIRRVPASMTTTGQKNPLYPDVLQPRDIDAKVSRLRVDEYAANPRETLVLPSSTVQDGAPWLRPEDGVVAIGNHRVAALQKAALGKGSNPAAWAQYRAALEGNAPILGFSPDQVAANPFFALFRVPIEPVADWKAFAQEGNVPGTARYGRSEQARLDAEKLTLDRILGLKSSEEQSLDETLLGKENIDWLIGTIRDVVEKPEWGEMFDAGGRPTTTALARMKAAIFQFAYRPEGQLTSLLTESTNGEIRNLLKAMLDAGGNVAKTDARIAAGEVQGRAIGPDVAAAADKLALLRADGVTVDDYLRNTSLFGSELTPTQQTFLKEFDARGRSAKQIRGYLESLADAILSAPHRGQGAMFQEGQPTWQRPPLSGGVDLPFPGFDARLTEQAARVLGPLHPSRGGGVGFIGVRGDLLGLPPGILTHPEAAQYILGDRPNVLFELQRRTGLWRMIPDGSSGITLPTTEQFRAIADLATSNTGGRFYLDFDSPIGPPGRILLSEVLERPTERDVRQFFTRVEDLLRIQGWMNQGEAAGSFLRRPFPPIIGGVDLPPALPGGEIRRFEPTEPPREKSEGPVPTPTQIAAAARRSLAEATIDTRTMQPGGLFLAGTVREGKLETQHVTDAPARIVSALQATGDVQDTQSDGPLGRGLYFGANYTSDPNIVGTPSQVPVSVQGSFLDLYALGKEGLANLDAQARVWLRSNGYVTDRGLPTDLGKATIEAAKHPDGLRYEYVKSLGYDGLLFGPKWSTGHQGIVWNTDAVRRYGDWTNPRPASGVAGSGVYAPPQPGFIRLYRGEVRPGEASLPDWLKGSPELAAQQQAAGRWFTDDLEQARWYARDAGPQGRLVFVDVPVEVADAGKVSANPEAARYSANPDREWFLPREYATRAEHLWNAVGDLKPVLTPREQQNPYIPAAGRPGALPIDQLPMRKRMVEAWDRHNQGQTDIRAHFDEMQALKREAVAAFQRANPDLVGTLLTDGEGRLALVHPGTIPTEPFRVTYFDDAGPYSHAKGATAMEVVAEAVRDGFFDLADPAALQRLTQTKAFADRVTWQSVHDFDTELRLGQPGSPAADAFGHLPFEVQTRVIGNKALMDAFRAGQVPDELSGYVVPRALDLTPPAERPAAGPKPTQLGLFPGNDVSANFPKDKLRSTARQVPTENLLDNLRPPRPGDPDLFPKPKETPADTEGGVELGMFLGVPRLNQSQRRVLRDALRRAFGGEPVAGQPAPVDAEVRPPWYKKLKAELASARGPEGQWRPGLYSLEGYLHSLGDAASLAFERALKNVQFDHLARGTRWARLLDDAEKLVGDQKANLRDVMTGAAQPATGNVRAAYEEILRLEHPDTGEIPVLARELDVRGYTGPGGEEGPERPFMPRRGDLMPRILKPQWVKALGDRGSQIREQAARHLINSGQAQSMPEARDLIDVYLGDTVREVWAPGLTRARRMIYPEEAYIQDPIVALRIRADQAAHRFAQVENLGKNFSYVSGDLDLGRDGWIGQIAREHGSGAAHAALSLFKVAYRRYARPGMLEAGLGAVMNYESMTKLPLAFIQNMTQNTLAGVVAGMKPWMQATSERAGFFGPDGWEKAREAAEVTGVWYRQSIRDMEAQAGLVESSKLAGLGRFTMWPWRASELNINRTIAPRTGILALERVDQMLRSGQQLSNTTKAFLRQVDLDPDQLQRQGNVTEEQIKRGAWGVLDQTQFMERPSAIPALFDPRGPLGAAGPFIFQWKGYVVRLNRLIWQGMIQEARQGNFAPLSRFALLVAPIAGELVGKARAAIGNRDRKWIWDEEGWDLLGHYVKNMSEGLGMGIMAEALERIAIAGKTGLYEFVAGPGLSQIFRAAAGAYEGATRAFDLKEGTLDAQRAMERWFRDTGRSAVKEVPLVGRPVAARLYTESEQMGTFAKDRQKAMHQAAQFMAEANSRIGQESTDYHQKAMKALEALNRKYKDTPGYVPVYYPSAQAVRDAIIARRETDAERARRRLPKSERGLQPPTFPSNLLPGAYNRTMEPSIGSAMTAMVAYPPGDPRFAAFMGELESKAGPIPRPPVMALAKIAAQEEARVRAEKLAGLPPGERAQIEHLMARLRPPGAGSPA